MKTAFVTGATGFFGLNLIEELLSREWKVLAFHLPGDDTTGLPKGNVHPVQGNILDLSSLLLSLPEGEDVSLFHVAGDTDMGDRKSEFQYKVNVLGTRNVVEAALQKRVGKLIFTSSISAFGYHSIRVDEATPSNAPDCRMNYNITKHLAEQEIHKGISRGLEAVILNPCNMLGAYDRKGWSTLIRSVAENKVTAVPSGTGTFAHVKDVARAHIKAEEAGRTGENYLLGGVEISFLEIYREIAGILCKNVRFKKVPALLFRLAMYSMRMRALLRNEESILTFPRFKRLTGTIICDDRKARRELSFSTTSIGEMLRDSYTWMLKEGILEGVHR